MGVARRALRVSPLPLSFLCALCNLGSRGHNEKAEAYGTFKVDWNDKSLYRGAALMPKYPHTFSHGGQCCLICPITSIT